MKRATTWATFEIPQESRNTAPRSKPKRLQTVCNYLSEHLSEQESCVEKCFFFVLYWLKVLLRYLHERSKHGLESYSNMAKQSYRLKDLYVFCLETKHSCSLKQKQLKGKCLNPKTTRSITQLAFAGRQVSCSTFIDNRQAFKPIMWCLIHSYIQQATLQEKVSAQQAAEVKRSEGVKKLAKQRLAQQNQVSIHLNLACIFLC